MQRIDTFHGRGFNHCTFGILMKSQVCIYKLHHFLFFPLLALRGLLCLGRGLVGLALDRGVVGATIASM